MIASNPVNHGRPNKLNCVEAIVSAFLLLSHPSPAKSLLSRFGYGHAFIPLNQDLLNRYSSCKDSGEMIKAGEDYLNEGREMKVKRREERERKGLGGGSEEENEGEGNSEENDYDELDSGKGGDEGEEELELAKRMGKVVRVVD